MPECLMVDKELLCDINSRKLEEKGCVHGRNKSIIRRYSLHIFQGMDAHIIVHSETIHDLLTLTIEIDANILYLLTLIL